MESAASYHPESARNFDLGSVEFACTRDRRGVVMDVRRTTLGERAGDVVVDRDDGSVKRFLRHVVLRQGHVHRKGVIPVPAGFLRQLQMCAWN